ncbi:MAG: RdgB/HAM1 family non-canonical purine NTP pyrophosphatase [Clostridia bacterium]|nr:RdgB/HAM1 family non-canonical purine NTP pyrophosphatase [Clostridia bacterium]
MEKLVAATRNENKIREIRAILGKYFEVLSMDDAGVSGEAEETGTSFEENALLKARYVMQQTGLSSIADDSGLEVDALGGEPGIYSARYSGGHGDDAANNELLLKKLEGVPAPRTARYVAALALVRPGKPDICCRGTCEGEILTHYQGDGGFGYDPLFLCETGKTFAEIDQKTKNSISHRRRGIDAVLRELERENV